MTFMLRTALVLLMVSVGIAQQSTPSLMPKFPTTTPDGKTVKVVSESQRFDFSKLTRTIPLPWNEIQMPASAVPAGIRLVTDFTCPSTAATQIFKETTKVLPQFGAPARTAFQTFKGSTSDGIILYMEWSKVVPADARVQICKLLYKANEKPTGVDKTEEFLVNDHTVIMWCFKNPDAKVKMDHQRRTFELISRIATDMQKNKK